MKSTLAVFDEYLVVTLVLLLFRGISYLTFDNHTSVPLQEYVPCISQALQQLGKSSLCYISVAFVRFHHKLFHNVNVFYNMILNYALVRCARREHHRVVKDGVLSRDVGRCARGGTAVCGSMFAAPTSAVTRCSMSKY